MAGEIVKRIGGGELSKGGSAGVARKAAKHAMKAPAKQALKHPAKHAAKHATKHAAKHPEKHAAKHGAKHAAKKSAGRKAEGSMRLTGGEASFAGDLAAAFHSMQRGGAVISLLDAETGGDLRELLHRGVELYRGATAGSGPLEQRLARAAVGLLQAAEHLAMAGLYAAREKHLLNVPAPSAEETERLGADVARRLKGLHPEAEGFAEQLCLMAVELLKRAEAADPDVHLAHELTRAAEGMSVAVENWPGE